MNTPDTPGISYRSRLPLEWQDIEHLESGMAAQWRQNNLALLQALATLESALPEKDYAVSEPAMQKALERLESKLEVALVMLARMLSEHEKLPMDTEVTLSVGKILWHAGQNLPPIGTVVALRLYLSPRLPQPLRLQARVLSTDNGMCTAALLELDEEMEEWLTRTLFRYHRRELHARIHDEQ